MPLTINLPGGRSIMLDENTGSIIGEGNSDQVGGTGGTINKDDWWKDIRGDTLPPPPSDQTPPAVETGGGGGGVTATTAYAQSQQNARSQADLAEQQRQFNEMFGFNKAKYNQDYELERGKTLLSLGSRPDTLTRYLYAIRGQQTPQALGGPTVPLPGFQNIFANPGSSSPVPPAAPQLAPSAPSAQVSRPAQGQTFPNIPSNANVALVGGTPISLANGWTPERLAAGLGSSQANSTNVQEPIPAMSPPSQVSRGDSTGYVSPSTGLSGFNTDGTVRLAPNDPDAAGLMAKYPGKYRIGFADGGVIPEPVMGKGMMSGQSYMFGEEGPETVVNRDQMMRMKEHMPKDIFEQLMGMGGDLSYSEDDGKRKRSIKVSKSDNSYASGGTIGYNPELFNPSGLSNIVSRGYNSTPDVPLLPSVGMATGGTSFIPSAQRLNNMLPSEQSSYAGSLQDEFGLQPDDVFSLAQKLAPKVRGLSTPRYS